MKNLSLGCVLFLTICTFLTSCSCNHEYDAGSITQKPTCTEEGQKTFTCSLCGSEKQESIPCTPHNYKSKIVQDATFDNSGELLYTCQICKNTYTEEIPKKEKTVVVTVLNKKNIPEDIYNGRYSDRVEFSFKIENQKDKGIRGISGILEIQDLFGKELLSINCDFTGQTILGNSSITVDGLGIDINQFKDTHVKLYNEDFSDLRFNYKLSNVIYENEQNPSQEEQHEDVPVSIKITNKENIPEDIYNGRYSPFVRFTIQVSNHSDKDIKGISGVSIIMDLFGKEILRSNCDFTGQTIAANTTVTYSDLGIDINEFKNEHIKLYNEKFEDLNFSYQVNSIVYTDGTTDNF